MEKKLQNRGDTGKCTHTHASRSNNLFYRRERMRGSCKFSLRKYYKTFYKIYKKMYV